MNLFVEHSRRAVGEYIDCLGSRDPRQVHADALWRKANRANTRRKAVKVAVALVRLGTNGGHFGPAAWRKLGIDDGR